MISRNIFAAVLTASFFFVQSSIAIARQANTDPLPTMPELQQLMTDKQWQPLLQKLARVLPLKGNAASGYDRYELLMMKGEAHVQLKQNSPAISAFNDAAKEPSISKDKVAVASTSALLVKRSQAFVYKRKSPTTQPSDAKTIDVLDRDKRKEAFAALAADEYAPLQAKAKAAASATNLRGVFQIMQSLQDLKNAEIAATGATPQTDALVAPLIAHSKEMSSKAVSDDRVKIDVIEKSANKVIDVADRPRQGQYGPVSGVRTRYKKQGLVGNDMQNLKSLIQDLTTISQGVKELAEVFGDLGKPLLDVGEEAQKLQERANVILKTDYSVTSDTPGGVR